MNLSKYWEDKAELTEAFFEGWQRKEESLVRKLIVAEIMNIPTEEITYHIKRENKYLKFVLGDDSEVDKELAEEESIKEKVQNVIRESFYKKDYETLCKIKENVIDKILKKEEKEYKCILKKLKEESNSKEKDDKKKVCKYIEQLVEEKVYKELSVSEKSVLDVLEKIYFCPIELFNEYVEESAGSENYYTILMEQWKTANEMAANISAQRNNMNNFYMSLMSILVGGVLFSNQVMESNIFVKTILYFAILGIGTVCCNKWIAQIDNYGRLNEEKYNVINALERKLSANVMLYEYMHTEKTARKSKEKISFSKQEKGIAKLFLIAIILVSALMLLCTWGEFIWKMN